MTAGDELVWAHHEDAAGDLADTLADVYVESWAHQRDNPFRSRGAFLERLDGYRRSPGFLLVTARDGAGELVGYIFGYRLPAGSQWWEGIDPPVSEEFAREDGQRTLALIELHVRPPFRRRGIAGALVGEYVRGRGAERATLCVDPANVAASTAYRTWGWRVLGRLQPFPDSPVFDVLLLDSLP